MKLARGDVVWLHDRAGRRPVLVLTRDAVIPLLTKVVVVPATSRVRGIPSEVRLGSGDGMPAECALTLDNVRTVHKSALRGRITRLAPARLDEVREALTYALGC